jgi:N-methylhydantoinase A
MTGYRIGVDIGGTFTDLILLDATGRVRTKKVLSSPDDYARAMVGGIAEICAEHGIAPGAIEQVVHGTTIVTNACIEKTGARVGLITTQGFRDVLEIGRGRLPAVLDLTWAKPAPLVPRHLRVEVDERIGGRGEIVRPLSPQSVEAAVDRLLGEAVESIAICLLNAPANPAHEREVAEVVRQRAEGVTLSVSSEVMPMFSEYERTSETVLNAYVMPLVSRYLATLEAELARVGIEAPLYIMQSSGGMTTPANSVARPIEIIECGPAAGVVGAARLGAAHGVSDLVTFDMGGTTAKASIVERGRFSRAAEYEVGGGINRASRLLKGAGYVVRVASIDVAEIGAGGGSLLTMDAGGGLRIGPQSAGAEPGPVCYGQGGDCPTITDADLVLGYINPAHLCGGAYPLDAGLAHAAIERRIAGALGSDAFEAAYGAFQLANAQMMRAIRAVSSERGRDPRKFKLYAFGGAGPVHAAGVAAGLGMRSIVVPPAPGVFSAYGLLSGDVERHYMRSFTRGWDDAALAALNPMARELEEEALATMALWAGGAAAPAETPTLHRFLDLQYAGQGSSLSIPLPAGRLGPADVAGLAAAFEDEHERTFGHRLPGQPIRATALRLAATVAAGAEVAATSFSAPGAPASPPRRLAYWGPRYGAIETPVHSLDVLATPIEGPVLIDCYDTTIVVPPRATIAPGPMGSVVIELEEEN